MELTYVGRYGDSTVHLAFCNELETLVQVEETEDIDSKDAILLNGFVVKIREPQFSIIFGLNK